MSESALDGLVVIRVEGFHATNPAQITIHARTGAASANTSAGMQGLADAVAAWGVSATGLKALMSQTQAYLQQVTVQDLSPTGLDSEIAIMDVQGGVTGVAAVTPGVSQVVTLRTGLQGRAFRGRSYIYGRTINDLNAAGNAWTPTAASEATTVFGLLLDAVAMATPVEYAVGIWHRAAGEGGNPAADTFTPVTNVLGRTPLASQRRRQDSR